MSLEENWRSGVLKGTILECSLLNIESRLADIWKVFYVDLVVSVLILEKIQDVSPILLTCWHEIIKELYNNGPTCYWYECWYKIRVQGVYSGTPHVPPPHVPPINKNLFSIEIGNRTFLFSRFLLSKNDLLETRIKIIIFKVIHYISRQNI